MENNNLADIGKRIKEQRKKNNLTQEELGAQLLVSREKVNYWETGSRDIKTGDLVALAKALNTTSDYLLGIERGTTPEISALIGTLGLSEIAIKRLMNENDEAARTVVNFLIDSADNWENTFPKNSPSVLSTLYKILMIANAPNDVHIGMSQDGKLEVLNLLIKDGEGFIVDYKTTDTDTKYTCIVDEYGFDLSEYVSNQYITYLGELLKTYHAQRHEMKTLSFFGQETKWNPYTEEEVENGNNKKAQ